MTGGGDASTLRGKFLDGMSHAACTVSIVTTDGPAGRGGVTVSAMTSVSADSERPTLLVCVHHLSPAARAIIGNQAFCVNVLRDDQARISDTFAGRLPAREGDKFNCATWEPMATGAPRLTDPLVAFDCKLIGHDQVGTHFVFFGAVEAIHEAADGTALVYANRAYGSTVPIEPLGSEHGETGSEDVLKLGCFHTFGPFVIPDLIHRLRAAAPDLAIRLHDGGQKQVVGQLRSGETDMALLYDFDLPADLETEFLTELHPYVLLPAGHDLTAMDAIPLSRLASEPLMLLDGPPSRDYFMSLFADAGLTPNIGLRSTSMEMIRGLVGRGLGYSLLATKPASAMSYAGHALVTRPLADVTGASRITLARSRSSAPSRASRVFTECCRELFQSKFGQAAE